MSHSGSESFNHAPIKEFGAATGDDFTMQRLIVAALAPIVLCSLAFVSGCGGDEDRTTVTVSPEAKKADAGAQSGMKEFMQSKGASKGSNKAPAKP
jgi:hypothetical protein